MPNTSFASGGLTAKLSTSNLQIMKKFTTALLFVVCILHKSPRQYRMTINKLTDDRLSFEKIQ